MSASESEWQCQDEAEDLGTDDTDTDSVSEGEDDLESGVGSAATTATSTAVTFSVFGDGDATLDDAQCKIVHVGERSQNIAEYFPKIVPGSKQPYAVVEVTTTGAAPSYYRGIQSADGANCAVLLSVPADNAATKALHGAPVRKNAELAEACRDMWGPDYTPVVKPFYASFAVSNSDRYMIFSTATAAHYLRRTKKPAAKPAAPPSVAVSSPVAVSLPVAASSPLKASGKKRVNAALNAARVETKTLNPWGHAPPAKRTKTDKHANKGGIERHRSPAKHAGASKRDGGGPADKPKMSCGTERDARVAERDTQAPVLFTAKHAATLDRIGLLLEALTGAQTTN